MNKTLIEMIENGEIIFNSVCEVIACGERECDKCPFYSKENMQQLLKNLKGE